MQQQQQKTTTKIVESFNQMKPDVTQVIVQNILLYFIIFFN